MDGAAALRFWEQPVKPSHPVDLAALDVYRASRFPEEAGPLPWLDGADWERQIEQRLNAGEIGVA